MVMPSDGGDFDEEDLSIKDSRSPRGSDSTRMIRPEDSPSPWLTEAGPNAGNVTAHIPLPKTSDQHPDAENIGVDRGSTWQ